MHAGHAESVIESTIHVVHIPCTNDYNNYIIIIILLTSIVSV